MPSLDCSRGAPPGDPNLLLVTLDTVRADHCSNDGYSRATTPNLAGLAREGLQFDSAYSPMPTTGPSHASMFTGLYPRSHGLIKNGLAFPDGPTTLAQLLADRGYDTAAVVSSFVLASRFGFQRGFAAYDDDFGEGPGTMQGPVWEGLEVKGRFDRRASETTARALRWLANHAQRNRGVEGADGTKSGIGSAGSRPFFLWVHYFDPHSPYDPPEPYRSRLATREPDASDADRLKAAYDGELAYTDAELGHLVEAVRRQGNPAPTWVIVVGDHGEGLGDHGHPEHGLMLYDEAVRVPFVVSGPGIAHGGRRISEPVSLVDLLPTIADLVGLSNRPAGLQGRSLAATILDGTSTPPERPVFLQRRFYSSGTVGSFAVSGDKLALRFGPWKYIEAPAEGTRELYELTSDPREARDRLSSDPLKATELQTVLHEWLAATPQASPAHPQVSEEDAQRLHALGYVP